MRRPILIPAVLAAASFMIVRPAWGAIEFDRLLPGETVAAFIVDDGAVFAEFWRESEFGQLLADPEMEPFLDKVRAFRRDRIEHPFAAETGIDVSEILGLFDQGFAVALVAPAESGGEPSLLVLLETGAEGADDAGDLLGRLARNSPEAHVSTDTFRGIDIRRIELPSPQVEISVEPGSSESGSAAASAGGGVGRICVASRDGVSAVAIGPESPGEIERFIVAGESGDAAKTLADSAAYQGSVRPLAEKGAMRVYLAPPRFLGVLTADEPPEVRLVVDALGLKKLEGILFAMGLDDTAEWSLAHFYTPGGKRGLLKLLDLKPVTVEPPAFVADDVASYGAYGVDLSEIFLEVLSIAETIQPDAVNMLDNLLLMAAGQAAEPVDIRKDIIEGFGPGILTVTTYPKPYAPDRERSVFLLGSRDSENMIRALRSLLRPSPESPSMLEEREYLGRSLYTIRMPVPTMPAPVPGGDDEGVTQPETPQLCMTALPGWLVLSGAPEALESMVRRLDGGEPGLGAYGPYREALGMLPPPRGYLEYTNVRTTMEYLATLGSQLEATIGPMAGQVKFNLPPEGEEVRVGDLVEWLDLLPAPERVARYFGVAVAVGESTADGAVFRSVTPRSSAP